MRKDKVMVTMIRENGNSLGLTYTVSKEDADYVEREMIELLKYCESRKIESE